MNVEIYAADMNSEFSQIKKGVTTLKIFCSKKTRKESHDAKYNRNSKITQTSI